MQFGVQDTPRGRLLHPCRVPQQTRSLFRCAMHHCIGVSYFIPSAVLMTTIECVKLHLKHRMFLHIVPQRLRRCMCCPLLLNYSCNYSCNSHEHLQMFESTRSNGSSSTVLQTPSQHRQLAPIPKLQDGPQLQRQRTVHSGTGSVLASLLQITWRRAMQAARIDCPHSHRHISSTKLLLLL